MKINCLLEVFVRTPCFSHPMCVFVCCCYFFFGGGGLLLIHRFKVFTQLPGSLTGLGYSKGPLLFQFAFH